MADDLEVSFKNASKTIHLLHQVAHIIAQLTMYNKQGGICCSTWHEEDFYY